MPSQNSSTPSPRSRLRARVREQPPGRSPRTRTAGRSRPARRNRRGPMSANRVGLLCALAGLFVFWAGYNYPRTWWLGNKSSGFVTQVYPNSGADLVGAAIVVLVIERLARHREDEERREQLVRECGSPDHAIAFRALLELRQRGWLDEGVLVGADLDEADLSQARLAGVDLSDAVLTGAKLGGADLTRAVLTGAHLDNADLNHARLEWARLDGAKLSQARLAQADMARADLRGADLAQADLFAADLSGADLSGARLDEADLSGANLSGADLNGTHLRAVRHDETTRWPDGFNPPGARPRE